MARKTIAPKKDRFKELLRAPDVDFSMTVPAERIPPQALEAEQSLLGSLLLDPNTIIRVADILDAGDFYKKQHRAIFQAMLELFAKHEPIDVLSVVNFLKDVTVLEDIGGRSYLASLVNLVPTPAHALQYAKLVKRKKILRDLIGASHAIAELGWSEGEDVDLLLDEAERRIMKISQQSLSDEFIAVRTMLGEAYERIERLAKHESGIRGVPTGFPDLDGMLSGLQKSDFVVLAARPSLGKSSLAFDIARHVAVRVGEPVGIFSLEMSRDQVVDRFIAAESGVSLWKLRTGKGLNADDYEHIRDALDRLAKAPIFIVDTVGLTPLQIRTLARRLQAEHGLGLVIVDYLQLITSHVETDNIVQQVTEISRALKGMARELNVPVLAVSQLSRGVESRPDQIPKLSDLRESGAIEQDADVVMFIWGEDRVKKDTPNKGIAEIRIEKHRNGPTGKITLRFDEERVSFWSLEKQLADIS